MAEEAVSGELLTNANDQEEVVDIPPTLELRPEMHKIFRSASNWNA